MHQQFPRRAPRTATLLRPAQLAAYVHVAPKTIGRWAQAGRLPCQDTLGGHLRSPAATIHRVAASLPPEVGDR